MARGGSGSDRSGYPPPGTRIHVLKPDPCTSVHISPVIASASLARRLHDTNHAEGYVPGSRRALDPGENVSKVPLMTTNLYELLLCATLD